MKQNVFTILAIIITTMLMTGCNAEEKNLRLLHWNIQNGMWDGQNDNYDRFVEFVKEWNESGLYKIFNNFKTNQELKK